LHLALEAAGTRRGDVVLVPSLTFTSTAEVARYLGAEIAFVDTVEGGFHMDPLRLEATIRRLAAGQTAYESGGPRGRPVAVLPVHYGGAVCDMDSIMSVARRYRAFVIEDAAHSFPSRIASGAYAGRYAGTVGDAGVFSFYATKTLATGEGGMVVTANPAIAARISIMRSHGIDRPIFARYTDTKASWRYKVVAPGFKYNLPDLLAAVGRVQLRRAPDLLAMRRAIARAYDPAVAADPRFILPDATPDNAYHLDPLRVRPDALGQTRDRFITILKNRGVNVSVHFIPLHAMPFYRDRYRLSPNAFPQTMRAFENEISLPIWPGMTDAMITRVIDAVRGKQ
jgi:dTDP-4-amino-4,6-dideoxygalactose transaminase